MLTKKDKKKRYNRKVEGQSSHMFSGWGKQTASTFKGSSLGGAIGGLADAASAGVNAGMQNAELVGVEEAQEDIDARKNFQSTASTNNDLLAEMAAATNTKSDFDFKDFMQDGKTLAMNTINATMQGAASGASAGPWGAVAGAAAGLLGGVGGIIGGRVKAGVEAAEKKEAARRANTAQAQTITAKAGALDQAADARSLAAYYSEGGQINSFYANEFGPQVTEFNTGGTHEENPHGGIPQGVAPDGLPNLVEEGEVKFDNYIFSDRLMLNKNDKKKYKFLKGKTYADAAKTIKRELGIDERPNDLIAKTDLEEHLNLLSTLQEEERVKRGLKGENRMMYKNGGHLFDGSLDQTILDSVKTATKGLSFRDSYDKSDLSLKGYTNKISRKQARNLYNEANGIERFDWSSTLQAAPVIGNALGVLTQTFNRPDYKHAKELQQSNEEFIPISYTPLTQKMEYKPFDVNYYGNKLGAQAGATRQAIREQTASNPYASTAALLSADANAQSQMGDLYRKAEEYNLTQREKVNTFNRATDSANAEMAMKTAQLNNSLKDRMYSRQLERDSMAARLKMAEDQAWSQSMSTSMTSMFDNLGDIAKQRMSKEMANDYILGLIRANGFNLKDGQLVAAEKAHGGKITTRNSRKNKKGFTV